MSWWTWLWVFIGSCLAGAVTALLKAFGVVAWPWWAALLPFVPAAVMVVLFLVAIDRLFQEGFH
jgi:hypothetical protein